MHTSFAITLSDLESFAKKKKYRSNQQDFDALEAMFKSNTEDHDDSYDIVITGMISAQSHPPTMVPYGDTSVPLDDGCNEVEDAEIEDIFCRLHGRSGDKEIFTETNLIDKKLLSRLEDLIEQYYLSHFNELDTEPDFDPPEAPEPKHFFDE